MDTQSHPEELQETLTINNLAELDDDYRTSASIENCFSNVPLSFSAVFNAIIIKLIFVFIHTISFY